MLRIEFEKGLGGVVNIINGNIRDVDRNEILNIEDVTRVIISLHAFSPLGFNESLNALQISGYIVVFDSMGSMKPYLDQIDLFDGEIVNPGTYGSLKYPIWDIDRDKTDNIVKHTYNPTDIEKEILISIPPKY